MTEYIAIQLGGHCAPEFGMIIEQSLSRRDAIVDCLQTPGEIAGHIPAPYGRVIPRGLPIRDDDELRVAHIRRIASYVRRVKRVDTRGVMQMHRNDAYRELLHIASNPLRPAEYMDIGRFGTRIFSPYACFVGYDWVFDANSSNYLIMSHNDRRAELAHFTRFSQEIDGARNEYLVLRASSHNFDIMELADRIYEQENTDFEFMDGIGELVMHYLEDGTRISIAHARG